MTQLQEQRKCSKCRTSTDFYDGSKSTWCKQCHRDSANARRKADPEKAYWISRNSYDKTLYGLEKGKRQSLLEIQGYKCAICKKVPTTKRNLSLDHDHTTGVIRGLLCHGCNIALGNFNDDTNLLRAAISYLDKYKAIGF